MRTIANIMMGTQSAEILLGTPTAEMKLSGIEKSKHYYVPRKIFLPFGAILIPIKKSLKSSMNKGNSLLSTLKEMSVKEYLKSVIPSDLVTDKRDYMTICEVLYYVEDSNTAFKYISAGSGVDIRSVGYEEFVKCIRSKYNTNKSDGLEKKYLKMCCYLLFTSEHNNSAIDYLSWLISYETSWFSILQHNRQIAECMSKLSRHKSARNILIRVKSTLEEELMIGKNKSLTEYILRKVENSTGLPEYLLPMFQMTSHLFCSLGKTNIHSSNPMEAKSYLKQSLSIHRILCEKKFLDNTREYNMITESDILSYLGTVYRCEGENNTALEYYTKSIGMMKAVYGEHTNHSHIAANYGYIGTVHTQLSNYDTALEYYTKSIEMIKAVHGKHANHSSIAASYNNIGAVHEQLSNYDAALEYCAKSLEMMKAVYGEHANHSSIAVSYDNIGDVHKQLSNYDTALEYYTKSIEMMKAVYGEHTNHSSIATGYSNIGDVHKQLSNYDTALEYYTKSLEMMKSVYGEGSAHPDLTDVISSIIDIYLEYKRYEDCLFLCYTPVLKNQCLSKVLNGISTDYIRSSNYRRAAQFLQIAISKAVDHSMEQADNYHQMGKCYMLMSSYKKSWCWLYSALCLYQSLPKTREVGFSLGKVHLSIAHLLLHIGHVTQSLEHCEKSLYNLNNLPGVNTNSVVKNLKTEILQFSDSLLTKMFTHPWFPAKYSG